MGCPYESKFPLDGTKVKYDKNIIGNWHLDENDLKIIRVDDYRFSYVYNDHDEDDGEETGSGYAVTNNGSTYLVVERDVDGDKIFAIYKMLSVDAENLVAIPLEEDNIPSSRKFSSSQDFTSYVIKNNSTVFTYANKVEFEKGVSSFAGYKTKPTNNNANQTYTNNNFNSAVLFKEDFQTSDNSWYANYDFKDSNYIYIATLDNPNNHYYLFRNRKANSGYIVPVPYKSIPRSNYSIEINAKHYDGIEDNAYGIKFAADGWTNCYNFSISANGYYRISKKQNNVYSNIVSWTTSSAIKTGSATNKLEVRVYSNYAEFYINGQYLTRIDITPFGSTAGLEVYNNQTVYFDDLYIKTLGSSSNYASSNILFREDFQTSDNNWFTNYDFKDSNYSYIATLDNPDNHYYLLRNRKKSGASDIIPIPFYSIPVTNYSIEIGAKHFDGENQYGYGIKFGASDWNNSYSFNITNTGYYRVSKTENGNYKNLIDWTKSVALYQGSLSNKLELRVYYNYVDVYINDQYMTRVDGFRAFGNYAGLEVYNNQTIYFDDLLIKKL